MEKGPIEPSYPTQEMPPPYYGGQVPPPGFVQPPIDGQPMPTVVHMVQVQPMNLGSKSVRMQCPYCNADVQTRVKHSPGCMTHVAALILCLVFWPCVCVPYCIDDCMDAEHDCPNCDRHIGVYKR